MDAVVPLFFAFFVYFVVLPAVTYLHHEAKHRLRWRRRELVPVPEEVAGGPFRDDGPADPRRARDYVAEHRGAPTGVKVTVVVSLVLGHMFLPGLFAGVFGLVFYGIGVVSIPGLILSVRIYRNAFAILRCDPNAAKEARELRTFALTLNVVVLCIVALLGLAAPELVGLVAFTAIYACISILHGEALRAAANAIDAVHAGLKTDARTATPYQHVSAA